MARNWPSAPNRKPIVTALGAPKPKVTAQSTPGTEPLRSFDEMPWNELVSSVTKVRTPSCRMLRYTANENEVVRTYMKKSCDSVMKALATRKSRPRITRMTPKNAVMRMAVATRFSLKIFRNPGSLMSSMFLDSFLECLDIHSATLLEK